MESAATGGAAHPPGACDPPQNCGGYMSLVGRWEETKFPAGINSVQTMAPGWRLIESEVALDLITIPAVSALGAGGPGSSAANLLHIFTPSERQTNATESINHFRGGLSKVST